jgi:hypothetical protein
VAAVTTPAVEREVAWDMIRRALPVAPVLIVLASIPWGTAGGASAAFAIAIVLVNFALSAALLGFAARISLPFLMGAALFGYLLRLALITVAVLAVKDQAWVSMVPLGFTLILTHLGLLFWETRHISASLAFPGVKPTPHQNANAKGR